MPKLSEVMDARHFVAKIQSRLVCSCKIMVATVSVMVVAPPIGIRPITIGTCGINDMNGVNIMESPLSRM